MNGNLPDAVNRAGVEASRAVGLALEADADVFNGPGEEGVCESGEGAGGKILAVGEVCGLEGGGGGGGVAGFEPAAGRVEGAELDGDAGADADEGGQGALVEGEGALVLVDGGGGVQGRGVLGCGLEADLDDVEGLA